MFFILTNVETGLYYVYKTNSWQSEMIGATMLNLEQVHDALDQFQMFDEYKIHAIYCHWLTHAEIDQLQRKEEVSS